MGAGAATAGASGEGGEGAFSEVDVDKIKIEPEGLLGLEILAKVASTSLLMSA